MTYQTRGASIGTNNAAILAAVPTPRQKLKAALLTPGAKRVIAPLCLDPLAARLCESLGYQAGYLSGGALGYSLAVSEALLTLTELTNATAAITRRSDLPLIVDGGVGFGDPVHVTRAIWDFEAAGAAAIELEDQVAPKRVSHHRGIEHLIPSDEMVAKIKAAIAARRDPDFLIIARTGALRHEGFDAAIARLRAYHEAGADMLLVFPETDEQWRAVPRLLNAPLAAMVPVDSRAARQLTDGWPLIIDPFTGQVVAFGAMRAAYKRTAETGTSGRDLKELLAIYHELPGLAGLEALYDIERATTEPGT